MKIIIDKLTKIVTYVYSDTEEIILNENDLSGTYTDLTINSMSHLIVENLTNIDFEFFKWGEIKYDNESFIIVNQSDYDKNKQNYLIDLSKAKIKADIAALEASVTPRRQREAILSIDTTWLADIEIQIGQLRQQLTELQNAI